MDIGIVTSFYNNYDKFLNQWVNSICKLKEKPTIVTIVQSGKRYKQQNLDNARDILEKNNFNFIIVKIKKHRCMGFARNWAVKHTDTKWIMYLDVDDTIKPDAITNLKKFEDKADVICGGLEIKSIGKKRNFVKNKFYLGTSRRNILKGKYICSSHSVYKRKLWEKYKYPLNDEFCNGMIWLGFAKLGARFIGINKICTSYLRRKNGHYFRYTKKNKKKWEKQKKQFLRKKVLK